MSVGEDVVKLDPRSTVGRDVKQCGHCGKLFGGASKKKNTPRTIKAQNYHMTQKPYFRVCIQKN